MKLVIFSQNNTSNGPAKPCIHMRLNDQLFIAINDCFLFTASLDASHCKG